jgi:hypothetical protein
MQKPGDGNTATLNIEALLHSEPYGAAAKRRIRLLP